LVNPKKKEIDKKGPAPPQSGVFVTSCFSELPEDMQKKNQRFKNG